MTAAVQPTGQGRARAWCPTHQDGINASPANARAWADQHNAEHHPNEERVTGL